MRVITVQEPGQIPAPPRMSLIGFGKTLYDAEEINHSEQICDFDGVLVGQFPVVNKYLTTAANEVAGHNNPLNQVNYIDAPVTIHIAATLNITAVGNASTVYVVNDQRSLAFATRRQTHRPSNSVRRAKSRSGRDRNFLQRAARTVAQIVRLVGPLLA